MTPNRTSSHQAIPGRGTDEVLRCTKCGFTTFEPETAEDHHEHECGEEFETVPKST